MSVRYTTFFRQAGMPVALSLMLSATALAAPALAELPLRPIQPPGNGCLSPAYPELARRMDATGTTGLIFTVGPSGVPSDIVVRQRSGASRGHRALDEAAVAAMAGCRFGEAVGFAPVRVQQTFVWELQDPPQAKGQ